MGTIHGLQVPHGIPVMFHKHHSVGTRQVQSQTTNMGGQQQYINGWVIVKPESQKEENPGREFNFSGRSHPQYQTAPGSKPN